MQIYGPTHLHGPQGVNAPHGARPPAAPPQGASAPQSADRLELSPAAQLASKLAEVPEMRHERIAALKEAIASGNYETEQRLDGAIERLLDEIG